MLDVKPKSTMKVQIIFFLLFLLFSCNCPQGYYMDNGKTWKEDGKLDRFTDIKEQDFLISVNKHDSEITLDYLTKFNAPVIVKDRGVNVTFKEVIPILENKTELIRHERESIIGYTDSTLQHRVKDEYFTCDNFQHEIKTSKKLFLKVIYDLDSSGTSRTVEKTYTLVRKKHCYLSVH